MDLRRRAFTVAVVAALFFGAAGCKRAPLVNVEEAPLYAPPSVTLAQITDAIVDAGESLDWQMTVKKPGQIAAKTIVSNKHRAEVDITYDTRSFSILYSSSLNLNYTFERSVTYIHPQYLAWVERLKQRIQQNVAAL